MKTEKPVKPLKGHPYHGQTDYALHYIVRDAGEAMRCMQSVGNSQAENKYADQVNDATTILNYRFKKETTK